jgi:GntR family transcriptional repressor for pyruvate dehydrogenase complex
VDESNLYHRVKRDDEVLSDQVAQQIISLIVDDHLGVGSRLPPLSELAGYLGVSRTAVREAIKRLDAWGIISVKHGVGTFVAEMPEDVLTVPFKITAGRSGAAQRKFQQVRKVLEPSIAALAAENAGPEHIERMQETLARMYEALDNPVAYDQADMDFHTALVRATQNEILVMIMHPVMDILRQTIQAPEEVAERLTVYERHHAIFECVKAGQPGRAREAMIRSIEKRSNQIE